MRARLAMSAVLMCLVAAVLAAQARAVGTIGGTVRNASGAALDGVAVKVTGPAPSTSQRSATTDSKGAFSIGNLAVGSYRVEFARSGFRTQTRTEVTVKAGATQSLTVQMTVDVVVGAPPPVQPPPVPSSPPPARAGGGTGGGSYNPRSGQGQGAGAGLGSGTGGVPGGVPGGVAGGSFSGGKATSYEASTPALRTGNEAYAAIDDNPFRGVSEEPLSTFSIDTDTASYANVRRFLSEGRLPPKDAVRIEELINYFDFDYVQPKGDAPFSVTTELADAPWNAAHKLALIGLQGRVIPDRDVPTRNLVFLLDVSGSMQPADRLPLIRNAMRMLVDILRPHDRVAIVVYAAASGLVLPPTTGDNKAVIHEAIARLEAGGSTNGGDGLRLAYEVARRHFIKDGINRVILATDGDFNVGTTSQSDLLTLIERERQSGVFLSVLGVGTGNLKDSTMELLADKGNGNYSYLDSLQEARKVLVHEAGATLHTIAKDVKIQVEFNPATVAAYRLIGYENRMLRKEDFNDDRKDAGEIGAGHTVTALYEIVPAGVNWEPSVDPLRYQRPAQPQPPLQRTAAATTNELLNVKLRYKGPEGDTSQLLSQVVANQPRPLGANLGFASAVAELGMLLRESPHKGQASFDGVIKRARQFRGTDPEGYRAEFIRLVDLAAGLQQTTKTSASAPAPAPITR